jgi:3-oxosteroid 1-dehydrogenase
LVGVRVVVLAKAGLVGGATAKVGGGFWIARNPHKAEVGVSDSREEALSYLHACAGDLADDALIEALVDN